MANRRGSVYGHRYQKARARLLASKPMCVECRIYPASTADHDPPLSRHFHRKGGGCCTLRPMCRECMFKQAGRLGSETTNHKPRTDTPTPTIIDPDGYDVDHPIWDSAPWLQPLRDIPADGWWPRLMTAPHPDAIGTYGPDFVAWVKAEHDIDLYWWQILVAYRLLEYDKNGVLVWAEAFLSVARQSGKSILVAMLCDWRRHQAARFGEPQVVMHTADTLQHALDVQAICYPHARLHDDLVRLAAGATGIYGPDGIWLVRSQTSVVGSSVSFAVVDEAHGVRVVTVTQNLAPTLLERAQAQLLLVSTAHTHCSELMPMYRTDALTELAEPTGLLMLEWSASPDIPISDPVGWRQSSPHWSRGRETKITRAAAQAMALPEGHEVRYGFDCQYRCRWPASDSRGTGERLLPPGAWTRRRGTITPTAPGWCAIEDNRGIGAAVAFAAVDADGILEVDGIACESWDEALRWARKYIDAAPGSRLVVGANMLRSLPSDFPNRSQAKRAGSAETRRGLSLLRSIVAEGRVVHDDTPQLDAQIEDARVRNIDGGLQLVSGSRSDLLRAALWALWFAQAPGPSPGIH